MTVMCQIIKCYKPEHRKRTNNNSTELVVSTMRRYLTAVLAPNYETCDTKSHIIRRQITVVQLHLLNA